MMDSHHHAKWTTELWWWANSSNVVTGLRPTAALPLVSLFWSLAVEEQFDLVWPWVARRLRDRALLLLALL